MVASNNDPTSTSLLTLLDEVHLVETLTLVGGF